MVCAVTTWRASVIKLLILDVDGVLTDGKKYYNREGEVLMKTFCDKDWTAIKRFRALGITVIFLTGDPFNEAIARNRNIAVIVNRKNGKHTDKSEFLEELIEEHKVKYSEIVYAGDDIFDIQIMKKIQHSFCPQDCPTIVEQNATPIPVNGGNNFAVALFQVLEERKLIEVRDFDEHLKQVYALDEKEKF